MGAYNSEADKPRLSLLENKLFLTAVILAMVLILAWALYSTSRKMVRPSPTPLLRTERGVARISHRFLLNGCNLLGNKELWDSAKTVCFSGAVQQIKRSA